AADVENHVIVPTCSNSFKSQALHRFLLGRMLKKQASFVLASINASTHEEVCFSISLAAASPDGLFEHPASANRSGSF
ncbi:MAG: hypothetical protein OEW20_08680, partial [Nitrospira sp.]|nr:hypothetical protein [Nitrospira sp.]